MSLISIQNVKLSGKRTKEILSEMIKKEFYKEPSDFLESLNYKERKLELLALAHHFGLDLDKMLQDYELEFGDLN